MAKDLEELRENNCTILSIIQDDIQEMPTLCQVKYRGKFLMRENATLGTCDYEVLAKLKIKSTRDILLKKTSLSEGP